MDTIQKKLLGSRMLGRIREMAGERQARHIFPSHPLVLQLFACFPDIETSDLWDILEELKSKGFIETGRTLNDYWVEAVGDG